ncbi:MAG: formyltransferase family protein, partial [Planctomycetaceae bacterium]
MMVLRPVTSPLTRPVRLAVLISGGGTTLLNFLDAMHRGDLAAEIPVVIASRADCRGVDRSRARGLRCEVIERRAFSDVAEFSRAIFEILRNAQVDLVTLAGFLSL